MDLLEIAQAASFLGLLIVTTFAGLQRAQLQSVREQLTDFRGEVADKDRRYDEQTALRAADAKRITDLEAEVAALRRTVTGEAHLVVIEGSIGDLSRSLTEHHKDAMGGLGRVEAAILRLANERAEK